MCQALHQHRRHDGQHRDAEPERHARPAAMGARDRQPEAERDQGAERRRHARTPIRRVTSRSVIASSPTSEADSTAATTSAAQICTVWPK